MSSLYPIKNPIIFLAFGLGSGLSPKAPGTAGSALALLFFPLLVVLGQIGSLAFIGVATIFGVWLCGKAAEILRVHDHEAIVWDEFVGQWLALWPLIAVATWQPSTYVGIVLAFILFRFFDILKPWPISWCDNHLKGGFGIMFDDVLAGLAAGGVMWFIVNGGYLAF